mgnify:CR=1 FL=1
MLHLAVVSEDSEDSEEVKGEDMLGTDTEASESRCQTSSRIVAEKIPRSPRHRPPKTGKKPTETVR